MINGAAVRVSLVCFSCLDDAHTPETWFNGQSVDQIHADLTGKRGDTGADLTHAVRLPANLRIAFMGDTKGGRFDIPGELARDWLRLPTNPDGGHNSDVLKPWMNGRDVTRRPADKWIVDFGWTMDDEQAALYEAPFQHVQQHVYPARLRNRRESYRTNWWRHVEPRSRMWGALDGLARYIVTPTVAKHRLFAWLDTRVCPDHQLIVIARDDDVTFGILHSRFHEAWSLRLGTWLGKGNDPPLHTDHDIRDLPLPGRPFARHSRRRLRRRPARRRHHGRGPAVGGTPRPLAQPARTGRVGGRTGSGLSEAPGPTRRAGSEGTQAADANEPVQCPPAMAWRRARGP